MNRKLRLVFLFFGLVLSLTALGQDFTRHNWYFTGNDEALIFGKSITSEAFLDQGKRPQLNIGEKITSTDPTSGDLIFYSDGINIYDGTNEIMQNGNGIITDATGIQAMSTSPVPGAGNEDLFYLFHRNAAGEILYTVVDRSVQGNRADGPPAGEVTAIGKNLLSGITDRGNGMITIGSRDMTEFWLITQNATNGLFEIHSIPEPGGSFNAVGNLNLTTPIEALHMAYNTATSQIAVIPSNNSNIQILHFNEAVPELTFRRTILNTFVLGETFGGSAGWSVSGNHLFFSRNDGTSGNIYRFNMLDIRDDAPLESVLTTPVEESLSLQLAPDSTIYHIYRDAPGGSRFMGKINQPDSAITIVNYESGLFDGVDVNSNYFSQFSPEANVEPVVTAVAQDGEFCMNNPIQFFPMIEPSTAVPTDYFWDFQPFGLTSNQQAPVMTFEQAGFLSATLSVIINGEVVTSNVIMREILENDLQVSLPDTTICEGETLELDAEPEQGGQGQQGGATGGPFEYLWSTGETTSTITVSDAGDYWVVITPSNGCPIYATARVQVYADDRTTANIWYFGDGAGLDFNEIDGLDPPPRSITTPHAMDAPAGTSTISDANGDVLFYTNGSRVWNRENGVMPNGTEIGGDSLSNQAVIIVPFVDDETLYYLFTTQKVYGENTFELKYSVVDMKEDNGRGDVTIKDVTMFTRSTEKVVAYGGAGNDSWLLAHEYGNNTFRAYPITVEGIGAPVISSAGAIHSFNDELSGQAGMKFSADGGRVAVALIEGTDDYAELFEFDLMTGEIVEFQYGIDLNEGGSANDEVYDVHFSPGGGKLFATMNNRNTGSPGGRVLEYRIDTFSTEASRLASRMDITDGLNLQLNFGQIQTGPNGQLYVAVETPGNPAGSRFVSSIAAVDDTLQNSGFSPQAVILTTGNSRLGLPNIVQNNANPQMEPTMFAPDLTCTEERIEMTSTGTSDIDEFLWSITNQADNSTVFSAAGMDTAYTFPQGQSGLFNISVNISNRCGFDTTLVQEIMVMDIPAVPTVPQAISICEGQDFPLDAIQGQPDDPNLSFEWVNSQGVVVSTDRSFTITEPEIYTVTVTNIAGCSNSREIFAGPPFEIELPDAANICQNEELILDPNVTADNYIWTVINPDNSTVTLPNQRRATVDTSIPGIFSYVVSIEDPVTPGCFVNDTTLVTVNAIAQATLGTIVNPACGNTDGSFEFSITTTGSYSYTVTGASSGIVAQVNNLSGPTASPELVSGLAADIYSVQITDNSSGCNNTLDGIQVQNDPPDFTIDNIATADAQCEVNDGSMTVTLSADIFPVTYTLTNTDDGTITNGGAATATAMTTFDFTITGLAGGTYDLNIVSNSGCNQSQTGIIVNQPQPVDLTVDPFVEICGPTAPLAASSTTGGATFSWTGPNGFTANGAMISAPESGAYTVTASAPGSCDVSETVVVDLTIQPIVEINRVTDGCDGTITLEAVVTNPAPNTTYVYNWDNGANTSVITVDMDGTYSVSVRPSDNLTCEGTDSEDVTIPEELIATVSSTPACDDGSPITLTVDLLSGAANSFTWTLDGQPITQSGSVINVNDEGAYTVTISDGTCSIERSIQITRQNIPEGLLPDVELYCPTRTDNAVLLAGVGFETYEWTLNGQPFPDANERLTVTGPGVYTVTMTTSTGCVRIDTVTIVESCDPRIIAPTAFVPSGNPPNNTFTVFPNDFVNEFQIFIYSRWGELIYQSNTLEFSWDGTFNGEVVPLGTYPYVMRFTSRFEPERGTFEQTGSITVVR
ncbi:T9SS type B sorting domain-containing protein [Roseivirga misakiensis]|uniref:PKD domain-containing protein n=1 Tax=Roseivirga misakiensis TaxID=1563681 RepID=A0A1E5SK58_9BACT|nr:gliding motility-associated C-terminal domain-containing protein [Roseivirga misakiensis]OEJ99493.1 hypothetical protein BFP71_07880 [Roseivirga misakiensis]